MKKKLILMDLGFNNAYIRKMLTVMRITVLFCLLGVLQVTAANTYSQEARISLNVKDAAVSDVLREIEEKSEFFFLYNNKLIDVDRVVDVEVKNKSITKVLDLLFADKVQRNISDRQIVLSPVAQQDMSIRKGTVLSAEDGLGLPGVSVVIKGTTTGISTDIEGAFTIKANEGDILVFSFMGMVTQEFTVVDNKPIEISLRSDALQVDEVVVVAYGVQKKSEITGSISTVSADKIAEIPVSSVDKALQGRVSGVFVQSSSGSPGSAARIRIRGNSSLTASNSPLYVVDGVPQNMDSKSAFSSTGSTSSVALSPLSTIPASDIESVSVLKDAAAMAIYGSRAANGVILITTKTGGSGETSYQLSSRFGLDIIPTNSNWKKLSPQEELTLKREGVVNIGGNPDDVYPMSLLDRGGTDWEDLIMREAITQEHSFSARGGNEKTSFYASLSYLDQEGVVRGSDLERVSARLNLDHKASDFVSFGFKSALAKSKSSNVEMSGYAYENPFAAAMQLSSLKYPKNEDGSWNVTDLPSVGNKMNPLAMLENNTRSAETISLKNNAYFSFSFLNGFNFKTDFSYDIYNSDDIKVYKDPTSWDTGGSRYESKGLSTSWTFKNLLTYNKTFKEKHNVSALVGYEAEKYKYNYLNAKGLKIDENIPYFVSGLSGYEVFSNDNEYAYIGALGKLSYNFDNKYYFSTSFRRDGSSKFGKNKRFANFGSVSGSWRITAEEFAKKINWLDDLKLRASYGTSGNSGISEYKSRGTYYSTAYHFSGGLMPSKISNDDLTWEKNAQIDLGLDFSIFNRVVGSIDVYKRKSTDMLLEVPLSYTSGFNKALRNVAEMENKGIDIEIRTINLKGEFTWETNLMFAYVHNEITKLPKGNIMDGTYSKILGENMSSFFPYAYAGVDPTNGKPMWWHIEYDKDLNGNSNYMKEISREITYKPEQASRHLAGQLEPKYMGSVDNTFIYKGFQLNVMFSFVAGNKVYAADNFFVMHNGRSKGALASPALNRWQKPGDRTDVPKFIHNNPMQYVWDDRHVYNGDYLRLRNVSLSYNLKENICQKLHLTGVKVYVQGSNLYTWHSVENFDPDRPSSGGFKYPNPRSFSAGINLNF